MKNIVKMCVRILFKILVAPLALAFMVLAPLRGNDRAFAGTSQLISLFPGILGIYIRSATYSLIQHSISSDLSLGFLSTFSHFDIEIEENVYIGSLCNIGTCHIRRDTLLGSGVHLLSGSRQHGFSDPDVPIKDQPGCYEKITIGEGCWIGNQSIVMASLGDRCIVAAGSVVTRPVESDCIVAGNPARVIRAGTDTSVPE